MTERSQQTMNKNLKQDSSSSMSAEAGRTIKHDNGSSAENPASNEASVEDEDHGSCLFYPPLYLQRYMLAIRYLTQQQAKNVADFGCSDLGFFRLLPTVTSLEKISLVDIDQKLLEAKKRTISPETRHYIFRRKSPLHVSLYAGSASDFDSRLSGVDAVTLIEVIEHLQEDVLKKVTENVFRNLQPSICVVTTPNSEFNILFGNGDPGQFRHWDHKFEWTRQEFHNWCCEVCNRYNYRVEYTGVGYLTAQPDTHHLGPCSQAAVFYALNTAQGSNNTPDSSINTADANTEELTGSKECYVLIAETEFPYYKDDRSFDEKLDSEVQFAVRMLAHHAAQEVAYGEDIKVSLERVARFPCVRQSGCTEDQLRSCLFRLGHLVSAEGEVIIMPEEEEDSDRENNEENFNDEGQNEVDVKGNENHESDSCQCDKSLVRKAQNAACPDELEEDWDKVMERLDTAGNAVKVDEEICGDGSLSVIG